MMEENKNADSIESEISNLKKRGRPKKEEILPESSSVSFGKSINLNEDLTVDGMLPLAVVFFYDNEEYDDVEIINVLGETQVKKLKSQKTEYDWCNTHLSKYDIKPFYSTYLWPMIPKRIIKSNAKKIIALYI